MTSRSEQITAAEDVLRPYITDPAVSLAGLALEVVNAYLDNAPAKKERLAKDEPAGFADFYAAYPRRQARRDAANAYRAAITRAPAGIILAGAQRYAELCKGTEAKYIKLPATWLRADCWADEAPKLALVGAAGGFEPASLEGWVKRLSMYAGRDGAERGTWRASWGPKYGETGCKIPPEAVTEYYRRYPKKTG